MECGRSFCDNSNRLLSSLLVMFLRARRWPVGACAFHIQPAKRTLRMSSFVLPVGEIVLPHVRQNGLARTAYRAPRERRLDYPIITSSGAISDAISDRVGKNRAKQEMTSYCDNSLSVETIVSTDTVSPIQHNVDNTGCLGIVSSMFLLVFLLASQNKIRKFEKIKEQYRA